LRVGESGMARGCPSQAGIQTEWIGSVPCCMPRLGASADTGVSGQWRGIAMRRRGHFLEPFARNICSCNAVSHCIHWSRKGTVISPCWYAAMPPMPPLVGHRLPHSGDRIPERPLNMRAAILRHALESLC
jgi:hypothetical protein